MARCNDCNKFVGYDEQDPECDDPEVDDGGTVTLHARIVNACADCGSELRTAEFDMEDTVTLDPEWCDESGDLKDGYTLDASVVSEGRTNRSDGKPGTPSRYRRTFYGMEAEVEVSCCDADGNPVGSVTVTLSDEVQASGMDEA